MFIVKFVYKYSIELSQQEITALLSHDEVSVTLMAE